MSRINGDKARFHRGRKKRIARRKRKRELLESTIRPHSASPTSASKPRSGKV